MRITGRNGASVEYDDYFIGVVARPGIGRKEGELIATRHKDGIRISLGKYESIPEALTAWHDLEAAAEEGKKTYKLKKHYEAEDMDHEFGKRGEDGSRRRRNDPLRAGAQENLGGDLEGSLGQGQTDLGDV